MKLTRFIFPSIMLGFLCFNLALATDLNIGAGNLFNHIGKIQTDNEGHLNYLSFRPYFKSSLDFNIYSNILLSPEMSFTLPKNSGDENTKNLDIFFNSNIKYLLNEFNISCGFGVGIHRIWSTATEEVLNNGTSTTTFPLPERAIYSRNFIFNLGVSYNLNEHYSFELENKIFNMLSSTERSISIGIIANYKIGEIF